MRESRGLSRRVVEDRTGVSQRHQQYLEDGEKEPGRGILLALSKLYGNEVLEAAFPTLVVSPPRRPTRRSNPGYASVTERGMVERLTAQPSSLLTARRAA